MLYSLSFLLYILLHDGNVWALRISSCMYVDDIQIYLCTMPLNITTTSVLSDCLSDINLCMSHNFFQVHIPEG